MKDHCLHCVLHEAAKHWIKLNSRASSEELVEMAATFLGQFVGSQPQYQDIQISVLVMGLVEGETDPRKLN